MPGHIDREIARLKLESMNLEIDKLTAEQEKYLSSWEIPVRKAHGARTANLVQVAGTSLAYPCLLSQRDQLDGIEDCFA